MADHTDLLVIGAGPYAYSAAAYARENGIATRIVGRPMAFWRDQMPADMYLRSGMDWHLDAGGEDTFAAFFEDRGLDPADHDPIPIGVFLDHTDWFAERKGLPVEERMVEDLTRPDGVFVARMADGDTITATTVLAVPGIAHYAALPDWSDAVPTGRRSHTSELVRFDDLAGARVVIVGGRQSAYEWAALLCDHGAERVDVVHRHDTPEFARVSWAFVDDYVEQTLVTRGWWRHLPAADQAVIASKFWQVGRLTLEHWLVPRLDPTVVHRHPRCEVVSVGAASERRRTPHPLGRRDSRRRPRRLRVGVPGRPGPGAVPLRLAGPDLGDRRLPRPVGRVRDQPARPVRRRLLGNPRLRPVLRVHQGVSVGGADRRGRDAPLGRTPAGTTAARISIQEPDPRLRSSDGEGQFIAGATADPAGQRADLGRDQHRDDERRDGRRPPAHRRRARAPSSTSGAAAGAGRCRRRAAGRRRGHRGAVRAPGCPGTGRGRRRELGHRTRARRTRAPPQPSPRR